MTQHFVSSEGAGYGSIYPTLNQLEKDELRYETLLKLFFGNETGMEDDTHKHYYLTVKFGIKTYESYLEWCHDAKEQIKEWEKK